MEIEEMNQHLTWRKWTGSLTQHFKNYRTPTLLARDFHEIHMEYKLEIIGLQNKRKDLNAPLLQFYLL
jgi:hypothetical protein